MEKTIRTACQACHCECGVLVQVRDGKVAKVEGDPEHPMNRGFICIKGRAEPQRVYHPNRLKYPLRQIGRRGEGKWERISWDDALDAIGKELTEIKGKYGSESIAGMHGTGPRASLIASTLLPYTLGSPNVINTDLHICFAPSLVAETATVGHSIMMEQGPDYQAANCVMVWGANPLASHPPRGREIIEAKRKRKAKLIVIDSRRTLLADKADLWLQVRPGTDLALALGMIHTIVDEALYDKGFVEKWCYGFDKLKERVRQYLPEKVAEIIWIPADDIREAARLYAQTKPAALHHRVAIEHNINSTRTNQALIALVAITGNIDVPGGNLLPTPIEGYVSTGPLLGADKWVTFDPEVLKRRVGSKEFPLISGTEALLSFVNACLATEAILAGKPYPIKAVYLAGGNPLNMQNSKKVWQAMKSLDLLVVSDFFMTPVAELADYVLPAATWIERDECCDGSYMNYISARQKAIDPLYDCRDDMNIVIELAKKIPWADRRYLPWNDVDEFNKWWVKGMNITFEEFKRKGTLIIPVQYRKYERHGFDTPTGKVELYSTTFAKHGYDPLPFYKEPPESPVNTPELLKDYPLILYTGGRHLELYHSEGRQIRALRKRVPDPLVEMHPETAKQMNIEDGDWVWIETPQVKGERVRLKAKLTESIHPRMVHARHAWWFPEKAGPQHGCFDSNINVVLSDGPPREEICGSVRTRGTLCKLYKDTS